MGQRPRPGGLVTERSPFKYQGDKDQGIRPHEQCEYEEQRHVVKPTVWPPPRAGSFGGDPSVSLRCELCGTWLIVYAGHATGELQGIEVVLPEPAIPDAPKRGPGRPRKDAA